MSYCAPSCAVPVCVPTSSPPVCYPVGGLGSLTSRVRGAYGLGDAYGLGSAGSGGAVSAATLGMTSGANVSCVSQIPPSEIMVQPPPTNIIIPGPILSSSCEPIRVGGYTACATGSSSGGGSRLRYYL